MFTCLAAYKFAPLKGLPELRAQLRELCAARELKGTILLSPEGINVFVAGTNANLEVLMQALHAIAGLEDLETKVSESAKQPFRRMLVKLKREIIAFGVDGIAPARASSPKISAQLLKQWLDEGKPVVLLDARNDYEIRMGTFRNALPIGVSHFRDFPAATERLPAELKDETIVMFCTGGIRCEKAGPFMERAGFTNVYQLDGGILKYFEACADAHYDGDCFVFDRRVCVDAQLHETNAAVCYKCQLPLTTEEQLDARYEIGVSCPFCHSAKAIA